MLASLTYISSSFEQQLDELFVTSGAGQGQRRVVVALRLGVQIHRRRVSVDRRKAPGSGGHLASDSVQLRKDFGSLVDEVLRLQVLLLRRRLGLLARDLRHVRRQSCRAAMMVVVVVMMLVRRVGRDDARAGAAGVWQKEGLVGLKERPGVVGAEADLTAAVDRSLAEGWKQAFDEGLQSK